MDYILGAHIALASSLTGVMFILVRRASILLILPRSENGSSKNEKKFSLLKRFYLAARKKTYSFQDSMKWLLKTEKKEKDHLQKDYWKKFLQEFKK